MKSENREQRITRQFVKCFIQTDFHQYSSTYTHSLVQIAKCFSSNSYFTNTPFLGTYCKMFFFQTAISPIHHSLVQIVKCFFFQTAISPIHHSLLQIIKCFFSKQLFHQYTIPWYRLSCTTLINKTNFVIRNPRTSYDKQLIESLMLKVKPNSS